MLCYVMLCYFRLTALHENGLLELFTSIYGANLTSETNGGGKNNVSHRNTQTMMRLHFSFLFITVEEGNDALVRNFLWKYSRK